MTGASYAAAAIAYEQGVVLLRRVAAAYSFDGDAAVREAVELSQTTTLTFTQAANEVVQRMGRRRFPPHVCTAWQDDACVDCGLLIVTLQPESSTS